MKILAVLLSALCIFTSMPRLAVAAQEEVTLSFALIIPPVHNRWTQGLELWVNELEKRSDGRIKVEKYFAESLSKLADVMDAVRDGVADMGESNFTVGIGRFLFHEQLMAQALPGNYVGNPLAILEGMHAAFPEQAALDTKGVKLLFFSAQTSGGLLGTKDKPVRTLDDLKGLKIGVAGGGTRLQRMSDYGATVVGITVPDMYMSLQKGVVDGICVDFELLVSRRLGELIKHLTFINNGTTIFYCVMNQAVYDGLPADLKKVVDEVSGDVAKKIFSDYWNNTQTDRFLTWQKQMGGTAYVLSEADYARMNELAGPSSQKWVEFITAKGLPGEAMLKEFRALEAKYAQPWPSADILQYMQKK